MFHYINVVDWTRQSTEAQKNISVKKLVVLCRQLFYYLLHTGGQEEKKVYYFKTTSLEDLGAATCYLVNFVDH